MTPNEEKAARELGSVGAASKHNCTNPIHTGAISQDAELRFLDFMRAAGLAPMNDTPVADGRVHRYRVDGDKAGSKNGWYVLHPYPIPHGAVGSWRTGETLPYRDTEARKINWTERLQLQEQMRRVRYERGSAQSQVWEEARRKAERLWRASRPADPAHPYLVKKRVKAWGIRQLRGQLIIPVRRNGVMHSLQLIAPDGTKKFITGGRVQGGYFAIGKPGGTICVAEGYATAATVYEATGYATAVAFNAGNLKAVAQHLAFKYARTRIILIADDDAQTPGNPGLTKATEAAMTVGGFIARPLFGEVSA